MNKKTISSILSAGILSIPTLVFGQTIVGMAASVANQVFLVGTWIVVICWVITGVLFLMAQGDPGKLKIARTALLTSIAGTVVIILAPVSIGFIQNSLGL